MKWLIAVFVAALLFACGCSGGSDSVANSPVDLNGTSLGVALVTGGTAYPPNATYPIVFTLVQSEDSVTGEYSTAATMGATSGTVVGTISGQAFNFTLTEDVPCSGAFTGAATISSSGISFGGTYSGADCSGTTEAEFSVSR